jgi:putative mRNA 3-end processing factor
MSRQPLLKVTAAGLYCPQGAFYIDPVQPVEHAVITHAHADHARPQNRRYLTCADNAAVLTARLGPEIDLQVLPYGQALDHNGVRLSLHPAGHVLGSAQVRLESHGQVWVVSGDFKTASDPTCKPFEPVRCHTFVTESTFGLPVFQWPRPELVFEQINQWWRNNRLSGKTSLLFAYSLGKAQRVLAGVDAGIGPIYVHGALDRMNQVYRRSEVDLPQTVAVGQAAGAKAFEGALVLAPPSADHPNWTRRFKAAERAMASGWMLIRGNRRRRSLSRGFVLSDHADWNGLQEAIKATGAQDIRVTHGYAAEMVRYLQEQGFKSEHINLPYSGETDDDNKA